MEKIGELEFDVIATSHGPVYDKPGFILDAYRDWISDDVKNEVKRRLELFSDGGLFLGPSHAIQVGSPMENIIALYRSAGSLTEKIDDTILSIQEDSSPDEINMSKLF